MILNTLKTLVRWGRIAEASKDDQQFPVQKITYQGKTAETTMVFPYGIHGNVPADSLALMFSVGANPENRACIAYTPQDRPTLAGGEVSFYHPPTDATITWRANGDLDIATGNGGTGNINITCANANVTCETTTVTATASVTLDTPATEITGTLLVGGAVTAAAGMAVTGAMTNNGKDIGSGHTHTGSPSAPSGPQSPTGVPV